MALRRMILGMVGIALPLGWVGRRRGSRSFAEACDAADLTDQERRIAFLDLFLGYTNTNIAKDTGIPVADLPQRTRAIRSTLRRHGADLHQRQPKT